MSRTTKGSKGPGFEFWKSRLGSGIEDPGKVTKRLTAKKERRKAKDKLRNGKYEDFRHDR